MASLRLHSLPRSLMVIMERHWNDNTRASLAAGLIAFEMLSYLIWYFICFYYDLIDGKVPNATSQSLGQELLNHHIVVPMMLFTLGVMLFSAVMCRIFTHITTKTTQWYVSQSIFVAVYTLYCTVFTQFFGENTIVTGLNLSGSIILGLFLLERRIILWAFVCSVLSFIFITLNRKLHWLAWGSVYLVNNASDYWFWTLSYLYFAVYKVVATIFVVDWILKTLGMQQEKIQDLSQRDTLTGICNRRTLYMYLKFMWLSYINCERLSIIYFDLDKFKEINDVYGHSAGDKTLVEVCKVVQQNLAPNYKFARMGGEEFIITLPGVDTEATIAIAEQLRTAIKACAITAKDAHEPFYVTASFGVATLMCSKPNLTEENGSYLTFEDYIKNTLQVTPELPPALQDLINMASNATLKAKSLGRDKIVDGGFTITTCTPHQSDEDD